ncbi:MAG: hypothetical protein U1D35_17195 [Paracoccaceae bacterium]|nr:hypothetical protein [Paracoccaceae bacterium]
MATMTQPHPAALRYEEIGEFPVGARLGALFAEMEALMRILPAKGVAAMIAPEEGRAELVACCEEDAVEAGFDNLPL